MDERIKIDESASHPTLAFIQDRETWDTIVVDRATGEVVGTFGSFAPDAQSLVDAATEYSVRVRFRSRLAMVQ
jgi:hypothetical protein